MDFDCAAETFHLVYNLRNNVSLKMYFDIDIDIDIDIVIDIDIDIDIFVNCSWVITRWQ